MPPLPTLTTARLRLRPWRDDDISAFAAMSADTRVMEFFPKTLERAEAETQMSRIRAHFERRGFGFWAAEVPGVADFIGFVGLLVTPFEAAFTPCIEIGWRLGFAHWGRGYATEGAEAALAYGFGALALPEIVAFTVPQNRRSRRVMEKLGMAHDPAEDFDHPTLPAGHPLRRHMLYRLERKDWQGGLAPERPRF